jgi:hypothetical protein
VDALSLVRLLHLHHELAHTLHNLMRVKGRGGLLFVVSALGVGLGSSVITRKHAHVSGERAG